MKHLKAAGLALLITILPFAYTGTASGTTLTSPAGTTYTSTIKAENEGTVTLTSVFGGFGAVSCKKSVIEGKNESHGSGVTDFGRLTTWYFTECTGGSPTHLVAAGSFEIHSGGGVVTSKSASLVIHSTAFGTCTFTTASTGTTLGTLTTTSSTGGNATIDVAASLASACGTGTLEGSYKITTPSTLFLD